MRQNAFYDPVCYKSKTKFKLTLDLTQVIKYFHRKKNKYKMPNIDLLLDTVAKAVKSKSSCDVYFSTSDLRYAYAQNLLDRTTREQYNFSSIGGRAPRIYQF